MDYGSEELESSYPNESDNEKQPKPKYEKFKSELLNKEFQFKLGMEFISSSKFTHAITEWSILNGREITFVKNENYRFRVECRGKCDLFSFV